MKVWSAFLISITDDQFFLRICPFIDGGNLQQHADAGVFQTGTIGNTLQVGILINF